MMQSLASNALYLLLFACLLLLPCLTKAQSNFQYVYCNTAANYTSGSVYAESLNLTLTSLAANASQTGFYTASVGQSPDVVYGLIQCRGDISKQDCQTCATTSSVEIRQLCPNQKEAYISYDYCSLHYADWSSFSTFNNVQRKYILYNVQNATDPVLFNRLLGNLFKNLSSNAAFNPSRFAVGRTDFTDFINIYAMMQCTRDLTENDCLICLQEIASYIPSSLCDGKIGCRILSVSCNLRYEIYSFFLLSPTPPPAKAGSPLSPNQTTAGITNSTSHDGKNNTSKTIIVVATPAAVALLVISLICGGFLWRKKNRERVATNGHGVHEEGDRSMESLLIDLNTLRTATRNFSDAYKLGEGGFGSVYKGKLLDGREIAVKRLSRSSGQGLRELKTEVMLVAKLLHRNLVRLLGFCLEEEEKLLVYEYLPNGSLDKILFDQNKRFSLDWERRYKIIVGIARGLLYLHEDSQLRIIHRDLKASNILLDEHVNPKISDFGLARLFCGSQTQGRTSRIAGTYGYMAPEYAKNGHFSTKSDVYSFGVLVLEIVTGQKNSSFRNATNLQSYTWQHWANGTALELMDPTLGDQWPRYEVSKCIHIGLLCVQEAAADRPTMSEIVLMLSSYTITSPAPSQPAFFVGGVDFELDVVKEDSDASQIDHLKPESLQQSVNEVTISELDPR